MKVRKKRVADSLRDRVTTLDTESHVLLSVDPGWWSTKLSDKDIATIVCKLAQREEREMPHNSQGKP